MATSNIPPVDNIVDINVAGSSYVTTVNLPKLYVDGSLFRYVTGSTNNTINSYYQSNTLYVTFDESILIHPFMYSDGRYFTVPDNTYSILYYAVIHFTLPNSSGSNQGANWGYSLHPYSAYGPQGIGVTQPINSDGDSIIRVLMDVYPGQVIDLQYFSMIISVVMYGNTGNSGTVSITYTPYFTYYLKRCSITCYNNVTSELTSADILQQTEDLTTGFDSSLGDQASSELCTEVDNYLQSEDALYDQMQYNVPEFSLVSDDNRGGILLASSFLQSVYSSDSFISNIVTFVLTLGLILYIVGWLKKGSG